MGCTGSSLLHAAARDGDLLALQQALQSASRASLSRLDEVRASLLLSLRAMSCARRMSPHSPSLRAV